MFPLALALSPALGSCVASAPLLTAPSTPSTSARAPVVEPPPDPALADAPGDAVWVLYGNIDTVRQRAALEEAVAALRGTSVSTLCNEPWGGLEHFTWSATASRQGDPSVVLHGANLARGNACGLVLRDMFSVKTGLGREIRHGLIFASGPRVAAYQAITSGVTAGNNRVLTALRRAVPGEGLVLLVDMVAVRAMNTEIGRMPLPGLDRETARAVLGALDGVAIGATLTDEDRVEVTAHVAFSSEEQAATAAQWMERPWGALVQSMGTYLGRQAQQSGTPLDLATRARITATFEQLTTGMHFEAKGADVRATVRLDTKSVDVLAAALVRAASVNARRAQVEEAYRGLEFLSNALSVYVGTHRVGAAQPSGQGGSPRAGAGGVSSAAVLPPSAPRTPSTVPGGLRAMDPPGTWDHPAWRALGFGPVQPHAYSFEFASGGTHFALRAFGDLDGDGALSTFERTGSVDTHGEIQFDGPIHATDELE